MKINCLGGLLSAAALSSAACANAADLSELETLGKTLFFDTSLSVHENQSCASCHDPAFGFTSPDSAVNAAGGVVEGSVPGRFGNRKPPTAAYVSNGPVLHHLFEDGEILFVGGAFLDGRATGNAFGTVAADQAVGPFTNPVEMALPHNACVVQRACSGPAADDLQSVWGADICTIAFPDTLATACADPDAEIVQEDDALNAQTDRALAAIARSIAAYEASEEVNRFASRFDRHMSGDETALTAQEKAGLALFDGKAECSACHILDPGPRGEPALFTDFTYDNLGVPINPDLPWYSQAGFNPDGAAYIDPGLSATLASDPLYAQYAADLLGAQKVPTLRNLTAAAPNGGRAYMHNGYFKTLEGVVHFYNTRDTLPRCDGPATEAEALAARCWPAPEVAGTMNKDELGDLKLTEQEEADLVAFLRTLDDL